jgi:Phage tail tube protein
MTTYQTGSNALIAYKRQAGLGVPASGAGANVLRIAGGNGVKLAKSAIASNEVRNDGMSTRGRHGTQQISAAYNAEASLGALDPIIEAVMRGTWDATAFSKTQADFTSLTTAVDGFLFNTGNPITMGFRVGDVIRATGLPDAANNGRNVRIAALSSVKITTAEQLTANAVADTSCALTRPGKRLINPATLLKSYFTVEEYEGDIDESTVVPDFVWGGIKFSMSSANNLLTADPSGTGTGQIQALATGASPMFPAPVATTDSPFAVVDATIRFGGVDLVELTSFDLTMNIAPTAPATFGSGGQKFSPDVFSAPLQVSMNLTALRKDLARLADFIAETRYTLHILAVDNTAEPKDFVSIAVPNFTLGSVDPSAFTKQGGPRTQTIAIPAALVGQATDAANGFDPTMISFQTTAA